MALTNTYNFSAKQGDDFSVLINVKNPDLTNFDLTGYTARLHVRQTFGATTVLINLTSGVGGGLVISDPTTGVIIWNVTAAQTTTIKFEGDDETLDLVYDLEIVSSAGKVITPARGTLTLYREVTR